MAFIDEVTFYAKAGRGGDGVVRWRREKFIDKGGPAGGDGGRGGDVYAVADRSTHHLLMYRERPSHAAPDGEPGRGSSQHGANGEPLVLKFPVGTLITNEDTGKVIELEKAGDKVVLLRGGAGGKGNEHFKSSRNTTPKEFTSGKEGEEGHFSVVVRLIADIGLIGYPNAGKSSLLNSITNATSKVGSFAFTTLEPHLGKFHEYTIADIPGLIEGAGMGKGLGIKFLKHIQKTKILLHLISFEHLITGTPGSMMKAYKAIRKELKTYDPELIEKPEIVILTKTDVIEDKKIIEKKVKEFEKLDIPVLTLSLYDDTSIKKLEDTITKFLKKIK